MKAISISDREFEIEKDNKTSLIRVDEGLVKGSDQTQVAKKKVQLDTLQSLSIILLEYDQLQKPKNKVFALLAFEADYIIKSYLNTPIEEVTLHSGKHLKENVNEIPNDIVGFIY